MTTPPPPYRALLATQDTLHTAIDALTATIDERLHAGQPVWDDMRDLQRHLDAAAHLAEALHHHNGGGIR